MTRATSSGQACTTIRQGSDNQSLTVKYFTKRVKAVRVSSKMKKLLLTYYFDNSEVVHLVNVVIQLVIKAKSKDSSLLLPLISETMPFNDSIAVD